MTREEAIEVLKKTVDNSVKMTMREWEEFDKLMVEAVDMAIEALSADAEKPYKTCGYYNLKCPKDCEHNKGGGTE